MAVEDLPGVNAALNAASFAVAFAGWRRARAHDATGHRNLMVGALLLSTVFLGCYVVYHALHGHTVFPGTGWARVLYLAILGTHVPLAMALLPLVGTAVWRASRGEIERHRRIVRWAFPIWMYVSVTGVVVWVMLYRVEWK
jgi:putative membrane protein